MSLSDHNLKTLSDPEVPRGLMEQRFALMGSWGAQDVVRSPTRSSAINATHATVHWGGVTKTHTRSGVEGKLSASTRSARRHA